MRLPSSTNSPLPMPRVPGTIHLGHICGDVGDVLRTGEMVLRGSHPSMRKSQRLPERKSTSCLASTRKCCPAMRGVEPSASPFPSAPWHDAQWSKSASPLTALGVARSAPSSSRCAGTRRLRGPKQQGTRKSQNENLQVSDLKAFSVSEAQSVLSTAAANSYTW